MKHMKKLAGIALALAMLVALAVPAMAVTFTKGDKVSDTSEITTYQIFKGDSADNGNSLANIQWGADMARPDDFIKALKATGIAELQNLHVVGDLVGTTDEGNNVVATSSSTAQEVAEAISAAMPLSVANQTAIANAAFQGVSGNGTALGTDVGDGWYLIRNRDTLGNNDPNDDTNVFTLQQVTSATKDPIVINPKSDEPGLIKKIVKTDGTKADETDAAFGDTVSFELTANLPGNFTSSAIVTYSMIFHDTQEEGLTLNPDSIALTAKGTTLVRGTDYEVRIPGTDGCTFEVELIAKGTVSATVQSLGLSNGDPIVLTYNATLNENANVGTDGNKNTAKLTYIENSTPKDTPEDTVIVFTFNTIVNKVDPEGTPLKGAAFALKDENGDIIKEFEAGEDTAFTFSGLKAGKYILEETKAPAGYNKLEKPIYFVIEYGTTNEEVPSLTKLEAYQTDENWTKITGTTTTNFTATLEPDDASVNTNIVNRTGVVLPDTGGIGTTIFYIVGGVLVVAAAILLITKRRMKLNED
ncbi:MAG: isopeptide-forming domain-containing fimbrial protein [Oscillibacter sp.]|nr:isopeptide-forming domain-containing fimbrial protein [Oscillibacter sp.]